MSSACVTRPFDLNQNFFLRIFLLAHASCVCLTFMLALDAYMLHFTLRISVTLSANELTGSCSMLISLIWASLLDSSIFYLRLWTRCPAPLGFVLLLEPPHLKCHHYAKLIQPKSFRSQSRVKISAREEPSYLWNVATDVYCVDDNFNKFSDLTSLTFMTGNNFSYRRSQKRFLQMI